MHSDGELVVAMRIHFQPEDVEPARCGVARGSLWPRVEKLHLPPQPKCACCGDKMDPHAGTQVPHIFPFHFALGGAFQRVRLMGPAPEQPESP